MIKIKKNVLCVSQPPLNRANNCFILFFSGKLLSKTQKVAYNLLNKVGQKGEVPIKPGDRVGNSSVSWKIMSCLTLLKQMIQVLSLEQKFQ